MTDRELLESIQKQISEHLSGEPITDIQAIYTENRIIVTWKANREILFDIKYYIPKEMNEWEHSVHKYTGKYVNSADQKFVIGVGTGRNWVIKLESDEWRSETLEVKKDEGESKKNLHLIKRYTPNIVQGDTYISSINGAVSKDGTLRIYYEERAVGGHPNRIKVLESSDLKNWKDLGYTDTLLDHVMYHTGWGSGWKACGKDDNGIALYESEDGIHFHQVKTVAKDWIYDTKFNLVFDDNRNQFILYGRSRGNHSTERGGMGDNLRRRGISRHRSLSPDFSGGWRGSGELVADPKDFWDYDKGVRYDFYIPNVAYDNGIYRAFPSVFFREQDRLVNRGGDTPISKKDNADQKRWRYVGKWHPVEMKSENGWDWELIDDKMTYITDPFKRQLPQPPYYYSGKNIKERFTDKEEPPMIDAMFVRHNDNPYLILSQTGRDYFQIVNEKIDAGVYLYNL